MLTFDPHDDNYIEELSTYVAIPSVSRDASAETMEEAAQWLATQLSFANGRVVPTAGHPAVRGEWLGAFGAPTILVYGHYDVQPTGDLAEWNTPPFELIRDGEVIRGRGVTDDKGPVLIVLKVAQAFLAQEGKLPLNVKFLFEGEEEVGSPNLPDYVRAHAEELAADLVISADGAMWRPTEPSLSVGSKGLVTFDLKVSGAKEDLHSGRYGGTVANPVHVLSEILAGFHNRDGSITVEGFYDGIPPLTSERRAEIAKVVFSDEEYRKTLGIDELFGEAGYSTIERLWERPTLEINGIQAGGKYTVIPHLATAHISCRLVPGQIPENVLGAIKKHIEKIEHDGVKIAMRADHGGVPAYTIPADHPANRAATTALEEVYPGESVLLAVIGGTLPATALFEDVLGVKTLFFSFATADEKHHAPNEFMRIKRLREGMRAWEVLWRLLADGPHKLAIVGK
ncbi:MAG: dipeptidase [Actinobacteria bacterium]|nr:dipeptidase [Actinomycetota bacterium]